MKESPPLSKDVASMNMLSFVGAPVEVIGTVTMDSGGSHMSCLAMTLHFERVLATRFLICCLQSKLLGFRWTEKIYFGIDPAIVGIWCAEVPTCQNLFPLFRMVLSCQANCVSSPISKFAVIFLTT